MTLRAFREASLATQVVLMFGSVAFVAAGLTWSIVDAALGVGLAGAAGREADQVRLATAVGVALVLVCTGITIMGAAALLRSTITSTVLSLQRATAAIAAGDFGHRVHSSRTDELGRLARSIDTMAERLHDLDGARSRLIATVSHELRTPLTVIRGHAFTLSRTEQDPRRRERFELIDSEVEHLARLIDDLLAAATLRAAPVSLDVRPHDAAALLDRTARRFHLDAERSGVAVVVSAPQDVAVLVDAARIDQVLGNLVSNAIAHAPRGTSVRLGCEVADVVRLTVHNAGVPIDGGLLESIFEPFVQGPAPTGAVGLGLSIARDIVRAHGADITVRSGDDGTEFGFELERASAAQSGRAAVPGLVVREVGCAR